MCCRLPFAPVGNRTIHDSEKRDKGENSVGLETNDRATVDM